MSFYDFLPWLKGLHVAAALLFFGGLLAVTLFLAALRTDEPMTDGQKRTSATISNWDRKVTAPALGLVWVLGTTLAITEGWFTSPWLIVKLVFVILLSGLHGTQSGLLRRLAAGTGTPRKQTLPLSASVISAICIAVLAVVKPF